MKKFIPLILLFALLSFTPQAFSIDVPSLPATLNGGRTYNAVWTWISPNNAQHYCYFQDPILSNLSYNWQVGIQNSRRYSPDGSCGGTYNSANTGAFSIGDAYIKENFGENSAWLDVSTDPITDFYVRTWWTIPKTVDNKTYTTAGEQVHPFPGSTKWLIKTVLSPAVGGVTTSPPGNGIWCGMNGTYLCQSYFDKDSEVSFEAYPNTGWIFSHWDDGTNQYTDNPHIFPMDSSKTITAVFVKENNNQITPPSLPFIYSGKTFNSTFAWIDTNNVYHACYFKDPIINSIAYPTGYIGVSNQARYALNGTDCGGTYLSPGGGLIVFSSNIKSPVAENVYWSGENLYTRSWWTYPWTLGGHVFTGMDQLLCPFPPAIFTLNIITSPTSGGNVTGDGIACNVDTCGYCQYPIAQDNNVVLLANANDGFAFDHWEVGTNSYTDNPHTFVMSETMTVKAVFLPMLKWPLSGLKNDRTITLGIGDNWPFGECPIGTDKLHTGIDISATFNETIKATETGVIKLIFEDTSEYNWGWCVVIEHYSTYTTTYWHLNDPRNSSIYTGATIAKGDDVGTVKNLSGNTHFHLGVRMHSYTPNNIPNAGALPRSDCGTPTYPAFPELFIDPSTLTYE